MLKMLKGLGYLNVYLKRQVNSRPLWFSPYLLKPEANQGNRA